MESKEEALEVLRRGNPRERLDAARYLELLATHHDLEAIRAALAVEQVPWVRDALGRTATRLVGADHTRAQAVYDSSDESGPKLPTDLSTEQLLEHIVHELQALLGIARMTARQELNDFESSDLRRDLDQLVAFTDSISSLRRASAPPTIKEFDLAGVIEGCVSGIRTSFHTEIETAGPAPHVVRGDRAQVEIVVRNALLNAAESLDDLPLQARLDGIVVTWGTTDRDHWLAIVDHGGGLAEEPESLLRWGATSKGRHMGIGLAVSALAARSLNGSLSLRNRSGGGAVFQLRWPARLGDQL